MTFTYELPIATDLHRVRLYIDDTDSGAPLFQDEELEELLAEESDPLAAAALAAESLAARYRNLGSLSVGDVRIDAGAVATSYDRMADRLRERLVSAPVPYAGGVDVSDVETNRDDPTRTRPSFTRHTPVETWP